MLRDRSRTALLPTLLTLTPLAQALLAVPAFGQTPVPVGGEFFTVTG